MYKKINHSSLDANQREYILDLIESIERWHNGMQRNFAIDKRESLMVIQSRELRDKQIAFLFNYLMTNTSASVALNDFSPNLHIQSVRHNRAALVTAFELINHFDISIKELNSDSITFNPLKKQRNNQWFFIFDYLFELGGDSVLQNFVSKIELLEAA